MTVFREPTREWLDRLEVAVDALTAGYSGYDPADTGEHLLEDYVPGGGTLTSANFCASLQAAVNALVTTGGTILVPPGTWAPTLGQMATVTVLGQGYSAGSLVIRGAGVWVTKFYAPQGWTGKQFDLDGYGSPGPAAGPLTECWLQDMTLGYPTSDVSNTGTCVHFRAMVSGGFRNLGMINGYSGVAVKCTDPGGGNNSQYVTLDRVSANGWNVSFDLTGFSVATGRQVHSSSAIEADFVLDDVKGTFSDTAIQSSPSDAAIVLTGVGGSDLTFSGLYTEGTYDIFVRATQPSVSANILRVSGTSNAVVGTFLDVAAYNTLHVDVAGMNNAVSILTAVNGPYVHLGDSSATPEMAAAKYTLDAASKARLSAYTATVGRSGSGVQLVGYATGAEPATPTAGTLLQSSTYSRPVYYTGSAWKNVRLEGDPDDLVSLLWPYCTDIWDACTEALHLTPTVSTVGWKGNVITYNVGNAPTRDTALDASYPKGRLRPTAITKYGHSVVASAPGAGGTVGLLCVATLPAAGGVGVNTLISAANATATRSLTIGVDDGNVASKYYAYKAGNGGGAFHTPAAGVQLNTPTLVYIHHRVGSSVLNVNGVETSVGGAGDPDTALDYVSVFANTPTGWVGCTGAPTISLWAILHTELPTSVKTQMYAVMRREYNVKIDPT